MTAPRARITPTPPRWRLPPAIDEAAAEALAAELGLPLSMGRVLTARGVRGGGEARAHLRPLLAALHPTAVLADLGPAADRIDRALADGEIILVHGDYDVDGIAGTALLTRWLRRFGGRVECWIPHRVRDGYDLGPSGVQRAIDVGATLIVTVDCGIVAHAAVESAARAGIEVVVTDHHTPSATLPAAIAVVNPNRTDVAHPEGVLCGAGVAFKLVQLLAERRGLALEELLPDLDLVALATIADLVPLTGDNRVLVRFGLRALERTTRPGLRALMEVVDLPPGPIQSGQVGFRLAPRINALGRLDEPIDGVRLLLTDDPAEARRLAAKAERVNGARRDEDRRTLDEVLHRLETEYDPERDFGVVIDGEGWHPGVIGIVASRVVERIHRPVILLARQGERARGSGRSVPGFHLYRALGRCSDHLLRFGGHRQAAGLDLSCDGVEAFRTAFNEAARSDLEGVDLRPEIRADLALDLPAGDLDLAHLFRHLGPHGMGNPRPVFWSEGLRVHGTPREVGTGHLKIRLEQGGVTRDAIGFGLAERFDPLGLVGQRVDAMYHLEVNEYRGRRTAQLRLLDLRPRDDGGAA